MWPPVLCRVPRAGAHCFGPGAMFLYLPLHRLRPAPVTLPIPFPGYMHVPLLILKSRASPAQWVSHQGSLLPRMTTSSTKLAAVNGVLGQERDIRLPDPLLVLNKEVKLQGTRANKLHKGILEETPCFFADFPGKQQAAHFG